jgi:hypothetical protein
MSDDSSSRWFAKLMAGALFIVWTILVLDITSVQPPDWLLMPMTALVFLIIGRLWNIEVEKVGLPGLFSTDDQDDND